jgi:fucose permease
MKLCDITKVKNALVKSVYFTNYTIFTLIYSNINQRLSGFGGLGVACWPLVLKFAGSNPAEAVGFLNVAI